MNKIWYVFLIIFIVACTPIFSKSVPSNYFSKEPVNVNGVLFTVMNETVINNQQYKNINFVIEVNNIDNVSKIYYLGTAQTKANGIAYDRLYLETSAKYAFSETTILPGEIQLLRVSSTLPLNASISENELTIKYIKVTNSS